MNRFLRYRLHIPFTRIGGAVVGRKKRSAVDVIRTRLWLAELMQATQSSNLNQLGELIDDIDTKKLLYKYASAQNCVSKKKLADIDARIKEEKAEYISVQSVFFIGPRSRSDLLEFAPLWDALDGSMETVWAVLVAYDPAIAVQKRLGVSFRLRCAYLIYPLFQNLNPPAYWEDSRAENRIAAGYGNGEIDVDIDLITFAIAAWRMAHFMGDSIPMLNYILVGLLDRAIPDALGRLCSGTDEFEQDIPFSITEDFLDVLLSLDKENVVGAESAVEDMNYHAPVYVVDEDENSDDHSYKQPFDHTFLIADVLRGSVFEYLTNRKKRLAENSSRAI